MTSSTFAKVVRVLFFFSVYLEAASQAGVGRAMTADDVSLTRPAYYLVLLFGSVSFLKLFFCFLSREIF